MRKIDVNGNTVTSNRVYLLNVLRNLAAGTTYRTDSVGRIMVDLGDGGYIVFFREDEPHTSRQVEERFRHVEDWKDSSLGAARTCPA